MFGCVSNNSNQPVCMHYWKTLGTFVFTPTVHQYKLENIGTLDIIKNPILCICGLICLLAIADSSNMPPTYN